jgi:glycolate oxidase
MSAGPVRRGPGEVDHVHEILEALRKTVGDPHVVAGEAVHADYTHDEAITAAPVTPLAVVFPATTGDVQEILRTASEHRTPVVARGSGTGLSGGCSPVADGILIAFDRMKAIREIDVANQVAVVEPGVTLDELNAALAPLGLTYPVSPGEPSASLGGNAATNAGGMRAVRYGVTRHHVLGLEVVLADGTVLRTGGKYVKSSSGYDLTQLLVGSEGTLAVTTEVTVKVEPRMTEAATVLAPFATLDEVARTVPLIVSSGVEPSILEYIDALAMAGIVRSAGLDLGIPAELQARTQAYLVVVLEGTHAARIEEDVARLAELLGEHGALDVYVLPSTAGDRLIAAREKAFFVAKAAGADDILDAVIPRAAIPEYLARVAELASASGSLVTGCGHVGDGNVHLSIFQGDGAARHDLIESIFDAAMAHGGAISGEHGIGTEKLAYFLETQDPVSLGLMRSIKSVFDPQGILGPDRLLGVGVGPATGGGGGPAGGLAGGSAGPAGPA